MCYSAMVKQRLKTLGLQYDARAQLEEFENLFKRRLDGEKIAIAPALESNFLDSSAPHDRIQQLIRAYKSSRTEEQQIELFAYKTRLDNAEKKLNIKPTKTAQKEKEVALRQMDRIKQRLEDLNTGPDATDGRIWSKYFAPLIVSENGLRLIKPMRYLIRPMGYGEDFDKDFSGAYNARRDNLSRFWRNQYRKHHGILIISSFFENVKVHDFEKRRLGPNEKEENMILEFKPSGFEEMIIPCIWDHWAEPGKPDLYSFALITDEPPKEIAEAGHDRCPIFIKKENIEEWLNPSLTTEKRMQEILDDKVRPTYAHSKVA